MLTTNSHNFLHNSELSNYLDHQELEMMISHNKVKTFATGDIILKQGQESHGIYLVLDGTVIISAKLLGEGTTSLETLGPGNFLGEISFIEKVPCATSVIANSEIQCLFISKMYFDLLTAYSPETKYKIFTLISKQVCQRLKKMHDKITASISSKDMVTRSLFGEIIRSLNKPTETSFAEGRFDMQKMLSFPTFHSLNQSEIQELFKHGVLLKAPKHCTLIHRGEKNASCYIVIHGAVQSSIVHDNKVAALSVIGPATLFASISCINGDSAFTITFATCENAILFKFAETDLNYFQKHHPKLWYKLFDLICRSLVALEKSVDKLDIRLNIETYNR